MPGELSHLTALASLDLGNNPIVGGWQHLLPLQKVKALSLRLNDLEAVPAELSALAALTSLRFEGNDVPLGGRQHFRPQQQLLRNLDLSFCPMAELPRELSALTGLTRLALSTVQPASPCHWLAAASATEPERRCMLSGRGTPGPVNTHQPHQAGPIRPAWRLAAPAAAAPAHAFAPALLWPVTGAPGAVDTHGAACTRCG